MKYFQRLAENANVLPVAHEVIKRQSEIWKNDGSNGNIMLRGAGPDGRMRNNPVLPFTRVIALDLMRSLGGCALGEIWLQRIEQGRKRSIAEVDPELLEEAQWWPRYLIVLQDQPGSLVTCGEESVQMKPGDVWWFDRTVKQVFANNSPDDLLHLLVDIHIDP